MSVAQFDLLHREHLLLSWPAHGEFHGTGYGSPVKPAIGIDSNGQAGKLFETARLLDGLK
jgi:hypothetical protein